MGSRKRALLVMALLVLVVGLHAGLMMYWIHLDKTVGRPVAAGMMWPVSNLLKIQAQGRLESFFIESLRDLQPGWIAWMAVGFRRIAGTHPDYVLWMVLLFMVGTQLVLFDIGRMLHGAWAGVAVAALFPLLPDVAMMGRRWAPMVPHYFFLVLAADCLIRSRSYNRILPTLGFIVFAAIGIDLSTMSSDNMTLLPGIGAMALGAGIRGVVLGQGPRDDEKARRWLTLLLGAITAAALGYVVWVNGMFQYDIHYVRAEIASDKFEQFYSRWSWPALTAYTRYLYHMSLGPAVFVPCAAGLGIYLVKGRARAEVGCWLLMPLVAFSLINKKNPYYIFTMLPAATLVAVLGLMSLRWNRVGALLTISLVLVAGLTWTTESFPRTSRYISNPLGRFRAMSDMQRVFDTAIVPTLDPKSQFRHQREAQLMYPNIKKRTRCNHASFVQFLHPGDFEDVRFLLTARDHCVEVRSWPELGELRKARFVVVYDEACTLGASAARRRPGPGGQAREQPAEDEPPWMGVARKVATERWHTLIDADRSESPCMLLYRKKPGKQMPMEPR